MKKYLASAMFLVVALFVAYYMIRQNNTTKEYPAGSCLFEKMTLIKLREMARGELDFEVTQAHVDEINQKPLCKDFCKEQLQYAREYPDEWFAEKDLRETCAQIGITLPNGRQ